jgi:predicted RNA binding protein YcfA (HicA-like mRNA interferase family)
VPRRLSSAEIIAILESHGFARVSQRGSHIKFRSAAGRTVIVPATKKEIQLALCVRLFANPAWIALSLDSKVLQCRQNQSR